MNANVGGHWSQQCLLTADLQLPPLNNSVKQHGLMHGTSLKPVQTILIVGDILCRYTRLMRRHIIQVYESTGRGYDNRQ